MFTERPSRILIVVFQCSSGLYIYTTYSDDDLRKGGRVVSMRVSGDADCGFDPQ